MTLATSSPNGLRISRSALLVAGALLQACSSDGGSKAPGWQCSCPDGAKSELVEITGANPPFMGSATGGLAAGYTEREVIASGTATAYAPVGALTDDGLWTFELTTTTAEYRTRALIRHPANAADFSGTALVEWLNVSGGIDANPDYASLAEEITRKGHMWIGVSAQLIGIEGGPVLVTVPGTEGLTGQGLKVIDPERYGTLSHPGDGFSFDIFTQVARAVRSGAAVPGMIPDVVLAVGESQSAIALTTYYDGVQPLTQLFDGFYIHSRGAPSLPLVEPGMFADLAGSIGSSIHPVFRGDLVAPVMELQAESDVIGVLNSFDVRQPDTEVFRLWEVAGTSHADAHLIGDFASSANCGVAINDGPMHIVAKAAFRGLETWVRTGTAPPSGPLLETTTGAAPAIARDVDGIALGGIRTPPVDVPVDVLSGAPGPSLSILCILLGSTTPLTDVRLSELYTSAVDYQQKYGASADQTIQAGFVLEDDRAALLGYSQPTRIP